MLISSTAPSVGISHVLGSMDTADVNEEKITKTSESHNAFHPNDVEKGNSIYSNASKQDHSSKNQQVTQHSVVSATPQAQQQESSNGFFSNPISYIKNLFSGKSKTTQNSGVKNNEALTTYEALAILKNNTANHEKVVAALEHLINKALACNAVFDFLCGPNTNRVKIFCSKLAKDMTDTDSLLALRKGIFPFTSLSASPTSTNRDLFVKTLINEIDSCIDKNIRKHVRDKATVVLRIGTVEQMKKMYEEVLHDIQTIKAEMPPIGGQLTQQQIEKKSVNFLVEVLAGISVEHSFRFNEILERQVLTEPALSEFMKHVDEKIKQRENDRASFRDRIESINDRVKTIYYRV